jgi:hypothetical protein
MPSKLRKNRKYQREYNKQQRKAPSTGLPRVFCFCFLSLKNSFNSQETPKTHVGQQQRGQQNEQNAADHPGFYSITSL